VKRFEIKIVVRTGFKPARAITPKLNAFKDDFYISVYQFRHLTIKDVRAATPTSQGQ